MKTNGNTFEKFLENSMWGFKKCLHRLIRSFRYCFSDKSDHCLCLKRFAAVTVNYIL